MAQSGCNGHAPPTAENSGSSEKVSELEWMNDFQQGLQKANKENKPVLVDLYADWCGWCKKLEETTFQAKSFEEAANSFVLVRIDADMNRELVESLKVRGFPTVVFLDSSGNKVDQIVGFAEANVFVEKMEEILERS